jgi:hypothetical protein
LKAFAVIVFIVHSSWLCSLSGFKKAAKRSFRYHESRTDLNAGEWERSFPGCGVGGPKANAERLGDLTDFHGVCFLFHRFYLMQCGLFVLKTLNVLQTLSPVFEDVKRLLYDCLTNKQRDQSWPR